jgi:2-alkyl-3-oxoalkanoate reductase
VSLAVVTGASGCIGGAVARTFAARGWRVRALVRDASGGPPAGVDEEVFAGDLGRPETLRGLCEGADVVVHTAALVSDWAPPEEFWRINRDGTEAVLADALACGAGRFVYLSTADVFGLRRGTTVSERSPKLCPRYPYSRTKLAGETLTWSYARRGLGASVVYPTWVFGPGDRHLVPELLDGIRTGQLLHFDRGEPHLELVYSENLAEAIALVATDERAEREGYIAGDGYGISLGEFVDELARRAGLAPPQASIPFPVVWAAALGSEIYARVSGAGKRPLMTRYAIRSVAADIRFDTSKLRSLGYEPRVGFDEALRRTIDALEGPPPARAGGEAAAAVGS